MSDPLAPYQAQLADVKAQIDGIDIVLVGGPNQASALFARTGLTDTTAAIAQLRVSRATLVDQLWSLQHLSYSDSVASGAAFATAQAADLASRRSQAATLFASGQTIAATADVNLAAWLANLASLESINTQLRVLRFGAGDPIDPTSVASAIYAANGSRFFALMSAPPDPRPLAATAAAFLKF